MNLLVDVGNTAAKWRICAGDQMESGFCRHEGDWQALADKLVQVVPKGQLKRCYVASVAGLDADRVFAQHLRQLLSVAPEFYYSRARHLGVSNRYQDPLRLGVDRWLAMIEAWHREAAPVIVVDCGSALTIDLVDGEGMHRGGYIVPGLAMQLDSLSKDTGAVRFASVGDWAELDPGGDTAECVYRGVMRMTSAFINDTVVALQGQVQDTCSVILTGGGAKSVEPWLSFPAKRVSELVLDGLERVFREDDNRG